MIRPLRPALALLLLAGAAQAAPVSSVPPYAAREQVWPQSYSDVAPDPQARFGRLANGLRYAILHNATPKGQASLRLRIGAGSLDEDDRQQGLAHLLEHMAFKGSTHVPEGEMVKILERRGLAFGPDTNAQTSWTQTVYMLDLPEADAGAVDTGLMLLRETGSELTISDHALSGERGVVLSEERLRDTPGYRAAKAQLGFWLKGQRAADRFPIGRVDVIQTVAPAAVRAFWQAHYRPDDATVVVVGDVDPAEIEAKIKARFGDWRATTPPPAPPPLGRVAARETQARVIVQPGAATSVQVAWAQAFDDSPDTAAKRRRDLVEQLGLAVLNRRLERLARGASPPFISAAAFRQDLFRSARLGVLQVSARPDDWRQALEGAEAARRALVRFGFSQRELAREIVEARTALQAQVAGAATRRTPALAAELVDDVDDQEVFNSPAQDLALFEQAVRGLTAEEAAQVVRRVFPDPNSRSSPQTRGARPDRGPALSHDDAAKALGPRVRGDERREGGMASGPPATLTTPSAGISHATLLTAFADPSPRSSPRTRGPRPERDSALSHDDAAKALGPRVRGDERREDGMVSGPLVTLTTPTAGVSDATLLAAFAAAEAKPLSEGTAVALKPWPYTDFGRAGAPAERREAADLGATLVRFANGVRLTVKPTSFRRDQVLVSARIGGGLLDLPRDRPSPTWAASALVEGGMKAISLEEAEETFADRVAGASFTVGEDAFELSGTTRPADLTLQLQLLAAYATQPAYRPEAFERVRAAYLTALPQLDATPQGVLSKTSAQLLHGGDPRFAFPTAAELTAAKPGDLQAMVAGPLASGAVEVVVVGDTTVEAAIAAVASTFGALPPRPERARDPAAARVRFPAPDAAPLALTHKGRADQAVAYATWPAPDLLSDLKTARRVRLAQEVLQLRLTDKVRINQGLSYSPAVRTEASTVFPGYGYVAAQVETPPAKIDGFYKDLDGLAADLAATGPTADELERAKKPRIEAVLKSRQTNEYWRANLSGAQADPRRLDAARTALSDLQSITADEVRDAARTYLKPGTEWRLKVTAAP